MQRIDLSTEINVSSHFVAAALAAAGSSPSGSVAFRGVGLITLVMGAIRRTLFQAGYRLKS